MNERERYRRAWRDLRLRRWSYFLGVPLFGIVATIFAVALNSVFGTIAGFLAVFPGLIIIHAWLRYRWENFRCPRCGHAFFIGIVFGIPYWRRFSKDCGTCHLPKGAGPV